MCGDLIQSSGNGSPVMPLMMPNMYATISISGMMKAMHPIFAIDLYLEVRFFANWSLKWEFGLEYRCFTMSNRILTIVLLAAIGFARLVQCMNRCPSPHRPCLVSCYWPVQEIYLSKISADLWQSGDTPFEAFWLLRFYFGKS